MLGVTEGFRVGLQFVSGMWQTEVDDRVKSGVAYDVGSGAGVMLDMLLWFVFILAAHQKHESIPATSIIE